MNKQQLIDKAIDDLRLAAEDQFFGKRFLCRTQLTDGRFAYYGTDFPYLADDLVCAKHEFQARKAEREAQQHWYDYEHQKALRLPPVGEVVEFLWGGVSYGEVEFICTRGNNVVYWMISRDTVDSAVLPTAEFRPLDWNKRRIAAVNELADLIKTEGVEGITAVSCADSILAAGYRKCDNKTSSTQE